MGWEDPAYSGIPGVQNITNQDRAAAKFSNGGFAQNPRRNREKNSSNSGNWLSDSIRIIVREPLGLVWAFHANFDKYFVGQFRVRPADTISRCIGQYFPIFLVAMSVFIGADRIFAYGQESMTCLKPSEYWTETDNAKKEELKENFDYMQTYCASISTYFVHPFEALPEATREQQITQPRIGYYNWIGLILIAASFLLTIPSILWRSLCRVFGIKFDVWTEYAKDTDSFFETAVEMYQQNLKKTAVKIYNQMLIKKNARQYAWVVFIVVKIFYGIVLVALFFFLNFSIGHGYYMWGFQVLKAFLYNENLEESPIFARTVYCNVPIRLMGHNRFWTLQCFLKVNAFLEKLFFLIWWAILILLFCVFSSFFCTIIQFPRKSTCLEAILPLLAKHHIRCLLEPNAQVEFFVLELLGSDGVLFFELLQNHVSSDMVSDLCSELFALFLEGNKSEMIKQPQPEPDTISVHSESSSSSSNSKNSSHTIINMPDV